MFSFNRRIWRKCNHYQLTSDLFCWFPLVTNWYNFTVLKGYAFHVRFYHQWFKFHFYRNQIKWLQNLKGEKQFSDPVVLTCRTVQHICVFALACLYILETICVFVTSLFHQICLYRPCCAIKIFCKAMYDFAYWELYLHLIQYCHILVLCISFSSYFNNK